MVYYIPKNQVKIEDFDLPMPGRMNPENRWVIYAKMIPWDELGAIYVSSMNQKKGRKGIHPRLAIGALLVKHLLNTSDEDTLRAMEENVYIQYFLGFNGFDKDRVFDSSLMVHIRKRIGATGFARFNDLLIERALEVKSKVKRSQKKASSKPEKPAEDNDNDSDSSGNGTTHQGVLKLDATVADQKVRFPTDTSLLNECREKSEELIDALYHAMDGFEKPRTYRRVARKDYLNFSKKRRKTKKEIRKQTRKQLQYLRRNLSNIDQILDQVEDGSFPLQHYYQKMLWILQTVYAQQKEKYQTRVNSIPNRIVSAQQPYVRPIVRGKAKHNVEFGSKVNISEVDGLSRADFIRWEAYNEAGDLPAMVENYREMYGFYPEYVVVDKIYMNRANRKWMKDRGIKTVGPALGRPKKKPKTEEELAFEKALLRSRNHVEGKIGQGKNKYGLNQIRGKSTDSSEGMIHTIFFCMNLVRLLKVFWARILITINNYINSVKSIWRGMQEFDYFRSRFCQAEFQ